MWIRMTLDFKAGLLKMSGLSQVFPVDFPPGGTYDEGLTQTA